MDVGKNALWKGVRDRGREGRGIGLFQGEAQGVLGSGRPLLPDRVGVEPARSWCSLTEAERVTTALWHWTGTGRMWYLSL